MGVRNCSMFCCALLYVHSSIAIILVGKGELVALLNLSSWCLVIIEWLFLAVPWGCLQFVILVFPGHTHLLFLTAPVVLLRSLRGYIVDGWQLLYLATSETRIPAFNIPFAPDHSCSDKCGIKIKAIKLSCCVFIHVY